MTPLEHLRREGDRLFCPLEGGKYLVVQRADGAVGLYRYGEITPHDIGNAGFSACQELQEAREMLGRVGRREVLMTQFRPSPAVPPGLACIVGPDGVCLYLGPLPGVPDDNLIPQGSTLNVNRVDYQRIQRGLAARSENAKLVS